MSYNKYINKAWKTILIDKVVLQAGCLYFNTYDSLKRI